MLWGIRKGMEHLRFGESRAFSNKFNGLCKEKWTEGALKTPKPREIFKSHTTPGRHKIYAFISIFIGIPIILAGTAALFVFKEEKEREPFVPYAHLRIRHKSFPWGNGQRSFFHNPKYNALPDGYEDEEEE